MSKPDRFTGSRPHIDFQTYTVSVAGDAGGPPLKSGLPSDQWDKQSTPGEGRTLVVRGVVQFASIAKRMAEVFQTKL